LDCDASDLEVKGQFPSGLTGAASVSVSTVAGAGSDLTGAVASGSAFDLASEGFILMPAAPLDEKDALEGLCFTSPVCVGGAKATSSTAAAATPVAFAIFAVSPDVFVGGLLSDSLTAEGSIFMSADELVEFVEELLSSGRWLW
jgi:hypothetical protein